MAAPIIKLKRSAVEGRIPSAANVPLGGLALNTYDGYLYASKDVGAGVTVIAINPWRVGAGTDTYNAYFTQGDVGIGTDDPQTKLDVNGTLNVTGVATFNNNVNLLDNDNLYLGTDQDLRIYHSGSNAIIRNNTGGFFIDNEVDNGDITIRTDDGSGGTTEYIQCDGSRGTVELYHYGTQKFETTGYGVTVFGTTETQQLSVTGVSTFQNNVHLLDDDRLQIGGSVGTVDGL